MKITLAQLFKARACQDQRDKFKELFGKSVEVTEALCIEHASVFNWTWAADHLFPPSSQAEYNRAMTSAWDEYSRVTAPAFSRIAETL